jgi:hypothetical protein
MADRSYRILVAKDLPSIYALAGADWTILANTIKEFKSLDTDDDQSFGDLGAVVIDGPGFIALAWQ